MHGNSAMSMSTSPIASAVPPPPNYRSSPESIRSVFFTNLLLLGVEEHSSQPAQEVNQEGVHPEQQQQQSVHLATQHLVIDSTCGYGAVPSRPLDLHRHVFAKGHQSTKALEFVFWFLLSKLDKTLARERFKDCWPIQDRHDAREFRNVVFKWLEDLRKEGCFAIGHTLLRPEDNSNAGGAIGGLGIFLPTIRRSYLDDSIGERIEQLVLVLSTYVLSRVFKDEGRHHHVPDSHPTRNLDNYRTICSLASQTPVSEEKEEQLLRMIDDYVSKKTQQDQPAIDDHQRMRQEWGTSRAQLASKSNLYSKELAAVETDRRHFMNRQTLGVQRSALATTDEIRALDRKWADNKTAAWQPILGHLERYLSGKDLSPLDQIGKGSRLDAASVKKEWKRSLEILGVKAAGTDHKDEELDRRGGNSQVRRLDRLRASRGRLENRLKESRRTVERLQREKNILDRPYYRLLPSVAGTDFNGITSSSAPSQTSLEDIRREAEATSRILVSSLTSKSNHAPPTPDRLKSIRQRALGSVKEKQESRERVNTCLVGKLGDQAEVYTILQPKRTTLSPQLGNQGKAPARKPLLSTTLRPEVARSAPVPKANGVKTHGLKSIIRQPSNLSTPSTRALSGADENNSVALNGPEPPLPTTSKSKQPDLLQPKIGGNDGTARPSEDKKGIQFTGKNEPLDLNKSTADDSGHVKNVPYSMAENARDAPKWQPNRFMSLAFTEKGKNRDDIPPRGNSNDDSFSVKLKAGVSGTLDISKSPLKEPLLTSPTPLSPLLSRSIFRPRLGMSKKRRQSFEPPAEKTVPSLFALPTLNQRADHSTRKDIYNVFDDDDDMPAPGTPSKRRRTDFRTAVPDLKSFDRDVHLNDDNPFMVTAAPPRPVLKAPRSPGLTLEDLRAPTPKAVKVTGGLSTLTMPMMLMHTPLQKKLFQEEMSLLSKPSRPFPVLTPPSGSIRDSDPFAATPSPSKRSAMSSSIFSRFRSVPVKNQGADDIGLPVKPRSPAATTPVKAFMTRSIAATDSPLKSGEITLRPQGESTITKDPSPSMPAASKSVQPSEKPSQVEHPSANAESNEAPDCEHTNANVQTPKRHLPVFSSSTFSSADADTMFDPTASRNPWGRPPSWKPKSPRMIDMEKKLLAEKKRQMTSSIAGTVESPLESHKVLGSLKVSVYGRLDRPKSNSMSSASLSASSLSITSSRSDRSVQGRVVPDHTGTSTEDPLVDQRETTDALYDRFDEEDTREFSPPAVSPIKDTLGSFPTPVLASTSPTALFKIPLRSTLQGSKAHSITSVVSRESERQLGSVKATVKRATQELPKSKRGGGGLRNDGPPPANDVKQSQQREQQQQQQQQREQQRQQEQEQRQIENAWILDQPMTFNDDFEDGRKGEDETILNFALQPIFGGGVQSNGSAPSHANQDQQLDRQQLDRDFNMAGGLFDEDMPEGLDPDEALYDDTAQFS